MKKKIVLAIIAALIVLSTMGCGSQTDKTKVEEMTQESTQESTQETTQEETTVVPATLNVSLQECIELIGKDDAASAELLGGGEKNVTDDGSTEIGRIYSVQLFDEDIEVQTIYNENGIVYTVTMQLLNSDASVYVEKIKEQYGEPTKLPDTTSENGITVTIWETDGIEIRLYQDYEMAVLEITEASTAEQ